MALSYPITNPKDLGLGQIGGGTEAPGRVRALGLVAADIGTATPTAAQYSASIWLGCASSASALTGQTPGSLFWDATTPSDLYATKADGSTVKWLSDGVLTAPVTTSLFLAGNGTVGAPSFAFTNSATTGLYRSAADTIGIAVAGALDFSIAANTLNVLAGSSIAMANSTTLAWGSVDVLSSTGSAFSWTHTTGNLTVNNSGATTFTVLKGGTATSATGVKFTDNSDVATHTFLNDGTATHTGRMTSVGVTNNGTMISGVVAVQSIADNGTIALPTTGMNAIVATSSAADKTGVILTAGSTTGQTIRLINTSANSLTFAAAGTSNVADGTGSVLAALTAMTLTWESGAGRWFRG